MAAFFGGSMGFGQNFSVTEKSDIDMVIIVNREDVQMFKDLAKAEAIELFAKNDINIFWITQLVEDVEVNIFVYEKEAFRNICLLEEKMKGFIENKPGETQVGYSFSGEKLTFDRKVKAVREGFLYEKPIFADRRYWGGVPKQDFFYSYSPIFQKENYLEKLEDKVWEVTAKRLVQECGDKLDLSKENILNTHFTYQTKPEKLPEKIVQAIIRRTEMEIRKI